MKDFLYLGPSPTDETCVQVIPGSNHIEAQKTECNRYKELLQKKFQIPQSLSSEVKFNLKCEEHEFGPYYEVVIEFNDELEEAQNFAFNVENNLPSNWE